MKTVYPLQTKFAGGIMSLGLLIFYINESQAIIELKSLKIAFILANSADPDEMQHSAALHLGLQCCQSTNLGLSCIQRVS